VHASPADQAAKQLVLRLGRFAWLSLEDLISLSLDGASLTGLLVLSTAVALWLLERRKQPSRQWLHGCPRAAVSLLSKSAKAITIAAIWCRFKTAVLEHATRVPVTSYLAALPTVFFMSRQELSLFSWSIDSSFALALIMMGDLVSSNATVPPIWGAGGVVILGSGLLLAGIKPTVGFALNATAWLASAASHVALAKLQGPELECKFASPAATLQVVPSSGYGRASAAKLKLRVGGWQRPVFWDFDKAIRCVFYAAMLLAKPSWTFVVLQYAVDIVWQLLDIVYLGVYYELT